MDKRAATIAHQIGPRDIIGRRIITSNYVPQGTAYITVDAVICRPAHDLVWDVVWPRIVKSERAKAQAHLELLVYSTREKLGLPTDRRGLRFNT